jgi:hypothetical protein
MSPACSRTKRLSCREITSANRRRLNTPLD